MEILSNFYYFLWYLTINFNEINPQEKEFILQAAYEVKSQLEIFLKKVYTDNRKNHRFCLEILSHGGPRRASLFLPMKNNPNSVRMSGGIRTIGAHDEIIFCQAFTPSP